jgi:hypothetical protein
MTTPLTTTHDIATTLGGELYEELKALATQEELHQNKIQRLFHAAQYSDDATVTQLAEELVPDFSHLGFDDHKIHGGLETSLLDYILFEIADHLADSWCAGAPEQEIYATVGIFVQHLGALGIALAHEALALTALQANHVGMPQEDLDTLHAVLGHTPQHYQPRTPFLWGEIANNHNTTMADMGANLARVHAWTKASVPSAL